MTWLLGALGVIGLKIVADEVLDWCPWLAERFIRGAAKRIPRPLRDRYREEWLAELEAVPGKGVSKLLFAARVRLHAAEVRVALGPARSPRLANAARRVAGALRPALGAHAGRFLRQLRAFGRVLLFVFASLPTSIRALAEGFATAFGLSTQVFARLGATFLLVFMAPYMALVGLAIRLTGRPAFIRFHDVQQDGTRIISWFEFRSFDFRALEEGNGFVAVPTKLGRVLELTGQSRLPALVDAARGRIGLLAVLRFIARAARGSGESRLGPFG